MTNNTIFCGLALIAVGVYGYVNAADPSKAGTALIPAAIGGILLACAGIVIWKEKLRKHVMHFAAVTGVIGFIGGFVPAGMNGFDVEKTSVRNGLIMSAISAVFVYLCVMSFVDARKARKAAQQ